MIVARSAVDTFLSKLRKLQFVTGMIVDQPSLRATQIVHFNASACNNASNSR